MIGMWTRDIVLFITAVVRDSSVDLAGFAGGSEQSQLSGSVVLFDFNRRTTHTFFMFSLAAFSFPVCCH